MFFCSKGLTRVPIHAWEKQECIWILNKKIMCCQRFASRETNIKCTHVTVWQCTSWGGIARLLRTDTLITHKLLTRNVLIHVQGWDSAGFVYWPKITLATAVFLSHRKIFFLSGWIRRIMSSCLHLARIPNQFDTPSPELMAQITPHLMVVEF